MLRSWFTILLIMLCCTAYSQQYAPADEYLIDSLDLNSISTKDRTLIDSALTLYRACEGDICRIGAVSIIVQESWDINVWPRYNRWVHDFASQQLQDTSLDSATARNLRISYAGALNNIGYLFNATGQIDSALHYYDRCLEIQEEIGDKTGMSGTLINTGYIFLNQGLIERALEYYYQSLRLEEEMGNQLGIATALNGIGFIQYKQGDEESALENYTRSLTIRQEMKDDYGTATCLNNIGLVFKDAGRWQEALDYYDQCLKLQEKLEDKSGIAISLSNMGFVYREMGQLEMAKANYNQSLKLRRELDDKLGISNSLNSLAGIALTQGDLRTAKNYATQALDLAQSLMYPQYIRDAAETLTEIAKKQGKWREAFRNNELYIQMRDSVFNEETVTASIHQQYKYRYESQAMADSMRNASEQRMQEAENDRLSALAAKRKQQTSFLVIGILLSVASMIVIYNRMKTVARQKRIIEEQNETLEFQRKNLSQFAHTVSHDLKTPINGIIGLMHLVDMDHPDMDKALREKFDLIKQSAIKSGDLVSGILAYSEADKDTMEIQRINLDQLIKSIIEELPNESEVQIKLASKLPVIKSNEYQLHQVFSNLISNAIRYNDRPKGEGLVTIDYVSSNGSHKFTVKDNGPGIPVNMHERVFELFGKAHNSKKGQSSGIGLSIVKKLIEQNGGNIQLSSSENSGARFDFTWRKR